MPVPSFLPTDNASPSPSPSAALSLSLTLTLWGPLGNEFVEGDPYHGHCEPKARTIAEDFPPYSHRPQHQEQLLLNRHGYGMVWYGGKKEKKNENEGGEEGGER